MFNKGYLNKLKLKHNEAEAFDELERDLKAMREEEPVEKEDVEPVNEAYPVHEVGAINATLDLLKMCNNDIYEKIQKIEPISHDELPDYIYKDLCRKIGEEIIKNCEIRYRFDALRDEVIFVAVKNPREKHLL